MKITFYKSPSFNLGGALFGMISFFGSMSSSSAVVINAHPGQGFIQGGTFSGSVLVPIYSSISGPDVDFAGFAIAPDSLGSGLCNSYVDRWKTINGYFGYEVHPGVLLVIHDTTITGDVVSSDARGIAVNGSINSKGIMSGNVPPNVNGINCYSYLRSDSETRTDTVTQFSGSYGYYVSETASLTSDTGVQPTVIAFRRAKGQGPIFNTNYVRANSTSDRIIIKEPPMTCSVSVPPVDFGEVASTAVGNKVVVESTLGVNCTNTSNNSIPITYSMTPKTQAGDQTSIPMISKAGGTVGDIRGFLGANASADAGCVAKTSSVRIDGSQTPLRTVPSNNSAPWTSPLVWVLCPKATAKPGVASAAATFELNW